MEIRHIRMIINPVAGACQQAGALGQLLKQLRATGLSVEALATTAAGDARRLAGEAPGRADAVIAVGGDGTVCEVANGLSGSEVPLVIWPTGTENLVAKSLG